MLSPCSKYLMLILDMGAYPVPGDGRPVVEEAAARHPNAANPGTCDPTVFSQDCNGGSSSNTKSTGGGKNAGSQTQASSILAILIAGAALFWM
ncbi:hypothetical protein NQ176_g10090 [Zarea fungicola]|uniref:Uncharacterized protein n=1 Tax=Zarea fungicola TaxID=93591 RepID=A0ACC1MJW1_9HYPO|nr:hypothetical protein NQ176_g10090 [Lecanicillium fungicola]